MAEQNSTSPVVEGNIYAPPEARVDDVLPEGEIELADRGTRLGAAIVDGIIVGALNYLAAMAVGVSLFSMAATGGPPIATQLMMGLSGVAIFLAINGYLLAKNGQTVGKKLLGIKIVRTDGSKIPLVRIVGLRWLPMVVLGLIPFFVGPVISVIDALLIFRESRKCLHDEIADTIVIKA